MRELRSFHKSVKRRNWCKCSCRSMCVGGTLCCTLVVCTFIIASTIHTLTAASVAPSAGSSPGELTVRGTDIKRHTWPPLPHHDIWSDVELESASENAENDLSVHELPAEDDGDGLEFVHSSFGSFDGNVAAESDTGMHMWRNTTDTGAAYRRSKVLHIFPVPVDGECLSKDGRRTGTCFNAYECRKKGGHAKGECAMGFGVCCIFVASCNATISNNITYLVSPNFPSFMAQNFSECSFKVKMMNEDISQLRFDFHHFSLGQPNRRTGVCEGDLFSVSGGLGGTFSLCGQNSGQHMYYDVGGRALPRQALYGNLWPLTLDQLYPNRNVSSNGTEGDQPVEITMSFTQRFLPIRLWEIRIAQIPFSQRAPAGCLQYHTGTQGVIQTFNFAENGRHLANQNYRICMRQEVDMCSIVYQPCDEQSFRIGPSGGTPGGAGGAGGGGVGAAPGGPTIPIAGINMGGMGAIMPAASAGGPDGAMVVADDPIMDQITRLSTTTATSDSISTTTAEMSTASDEASAAITTTTIATTSAPSADAPMEEASTAASAPAAESTTATTEQAAASSTPLSDDVEGSGNEEEESSPPLRPSRRPRPVTGGFNLLGFLRNAFDFGFRRRRTTRQWTGSGPQQARQIYSTCSDRITMPCIVEDFIGMGLGALPGCEPVHCGAQFCSNGMWPCRIESTVTPFYIGVRFGDGARKGSAEDNIGACLRYNQVQCM